MKLKHYLYKKRISQSEFAKMIGVSDKTVWRILNGYELKLITAMKIHKATQGEISLHDLINMHSETPSKK